MTNSRDPLSRTFTVAAKQDNKSWRDKDIGFDILNGIIRTFSGNAEKIEEKFCNSERSRKRVFIRDSGF